MRLTSAFAIIVLGSLIGASQSGEAVSKGHRAVRAALSNSHILYFPPFKTRLILIYVHHRNTLDKTRPHASQYSNCRARAAPGKPISFSPMVLPRRSLGAMSLPSRFVDELNHINGVHINEEALSVDNPSRFSLEQKASPLQGAFPHNQRPCQKPVELHRADGCDTQAQHLVRSLRVPSGKIGDNGLNHWLRTRPHWLALGARRHPGISPTAAWPGGVGHAHCLARACSRLAGFSMGFGIPSALVDEEQLPWTNILVRSPGAAACTCACAAPPLTAEGAATRRRRRPRPKMCGL